METIRIIKKYPNRRLYDTALGNYITLEDVKKLVCDNIEIQVIDANTKKDLTQTTLLQIILEQEASATPIFTNTMLQELIRFYHKNSQQLLSHYLEEMMGLFLKQKDFMQKQWTTYQSFLMEPMAKPKKTEKTAESAKDAKTTL